MIAETVFNRFPSVGRADVKQNRCYMLKEVVYGRIKIQRDFPGILCML